MQILLGMNFSKAGCGFWWATCNAAAWILWLICNIKVGKKSCDRIQLFYYSLPKFHHMKVI